MAYAIQWKAEGIPDQPHGGMGVGASSPKIPDYYLQPGAAVLLLPGTILRNEPRPRHAARVGKTGDAVAMETAKSIVISLDSAVFASGQFVGPDTENAYAQTAANCTAWRAVDADVQTQIANGVPFATYRPVSNKSAIS